MNKGVSSAYQETVVPFVSFIIQNLPADTINSIQITTNNNLFCTTSWDGDVIIIKACRLSTRFVVMDSIILETRFNRL